jgi:magnesium transporter
MSLERRLAEELLRRHPERAALVFERLGLDEAVRVLSRSPARDTAAVLQRMSPNRAAEALVALDSAGIAAVLEALPLDVASRLTRRLPPERAQQALAAVGDRLARALRSLIGFPEGSAGALMDPNVLALPDDLTAREAMDRVREMRESARYNVYIVNHEQRLVGVVNLRELLLARPRARLADLMVREPLCLDARADRSVVVAHPGWKEVHALPVVDEQGAYLGAIRYRTLRHLEDELLVARAQDGDAREALARLFSAVSTAGLPRTGGR